MAAINFTPISLYYSSTASAVPSAGNLVNGELGLNIADMKLYAKNSSGVVTLLASSATVAPVTTISFGSTGLTPATATSGAVTVAGTLAIANGGTGQTTAGAAFNALSPITTTGDLILGNGTNSATRLGIGANGYLLTSNGTTASWQAAPAGGVTTFSAGTTGLTPSTATSGAVTLAGTLAIANGGTGQTSASAALSALGGIGTGKSIAMAMIFGF
jgi:trimeric autotransporter adhesin